MSETAAAREILAPHCVGRGIDIGFGGDPIVPDALTFDMPKPYTNVGGATQLLRGDARDLGFICDEVLDYVYSSHLVEDFTYAELVPILREWRRVLKPGGKLVVLAPDEQIYRAHCVKTGQPYNDAHRNNDFSLKKFRRPLTMAGMWQIDLEIPLLNTYSWAIVARKFTP